MLNEFHFLRPWWFVAIIPAVILYLLFKRNTKTSGNIWQQYCDPHLLPHLISNHHENKQSWLPHFILIIWVITITALAGPTWSLYAQSVYQKNIARVIALDVSQSMNSTDISPSRLERAKYKILDLLKELTEGQTGMVVFSSSPFVVSPLTNDSNTIASMIPVLNSTIVPVQGSDISKALKKSAQLLTQAGFNQGQIILITDTHPTPEDTHEANKLASQGFTTSVLAIGTKNGGPVNTASGGFATDKSGNVIFAGLDSQGLQQLASNGHGDYIPFTADDSDINQLIASTRNNLLDQNNPSSQMETKSLWKDQGHWLVWLVIILVGLLTRKGWLSRLC